VLEKFRIERIFVILFEDLEQLLLEMLVLMRIVGVAWVH